MGDGDMRSINKLAFASVVLLCAFIFIFAYYMVIDITGEPKDSSPIGVDFSIFYSAGRMAVSGEAEKIYDIPEHHEMLEKVLDRKVPNLLAWFYPPTFLLLIIPFVFLPYRLALIIWLAVTLALALYSALLLVPKQKKIALLAFGFPGIFMNLRWGQNGFLSTALVGFGLYFLDLNPVLAGLMFGLLTYKPQIAIFPILILLLSKKWRALLWTAVFSLIFILLSCAAFGFGTWAEFVTSFFNSPLGDDWVRISAVQPSFYSFLRLLGMSGPVVNVLAGIVIAAATYTVWRIWRRTDNFALKGAAMVIAIFLVVPYYLQYDLSVLLIPFVLLSYDLFVRGSKNYEIILVLILWAMPLVSWMLVSYTPVQICPIVLTAGLIITFLRAKRGQNKSFPDNSHKA
jgi:hypothetical protein